MKKHPKTTDGLMRHMRDNKNIQIKGSKEKIQLRNMGYFHGYKGYNFFLDKSDELFFDEFKQLQSLYDFDSEIKNLFYKYVMFIETAIKNRILENIHLNSGFDLESLFEKSLTNYKKYKPGTQKYKKSLKNTLRLKSEIYDIIQANHASKPFIYHFIYKDRPVPTYAVFELLTLGNLVFITRCLNPNLKIATMKDLKLYTPSFENGEDILGDVIDILKGLRNAVAHNGILYDCRFKDSNINNKVSVFINIKTGIRNISFNRIVDYLVLLVFICASLTYSKNDLKKLVNYFEYHTEILRKSLSTSTYHKIMGTDLKIKLSELRNFINNLDKYLVVE